MRNYLDLMDRILVQGTRKPNRTGIDTLSLFGEQLRFNLGAGFPLLTTKRVFFRGVVEELLWFIRGETNVRSLQERGVHIWDEWADPDGSVGPIYGYQWRHWNGDWTKSDPSLWEQGEDQLADLIDGIRKDPSSRRHVLSAWNVEQLGQMALAPCHLLAQFDVTEGRLSCSMYQRSADYFLGVPFNIASYALLTHLVAATCGLGVGSLVLSFGDVHLYVNHLAQVYEQLGRSPRPLPRLRVEARARIDDYRAEDVVLRGYDPHPSIRAEVAV